MISYHQYKPSNLLKDYIDCFWTLQSDQAALKPFERLIPDGKIELIFNFKDPYKKTVTGDESSTTLLTGTRLIGQRSEPYFIQQENNIDLLGVRFKSTGLFPFTGAPVDEVSGATILFEDIFGGTAREVEAQLMEASSSPKRVKLLESFFQKKLHPTKFYYNRFQHYHTYLAQFPGSSIENTAYRLNTTYKNLERDFLKFAGLAPKVYAKIYKFNEALKLMYQLRSERQLTQLAQEAGYYDQSHFIRDFKRFAGISPKKFLQEIHAISEMILTPENVENVQF